MTRRINPNEKSGELELITTFTVKSPSSGKLVRSHHYAVSLTLTFADRVLYARKGEDVTSQAVTLGGDKITVEDAIVSSNILDILGRCPIFEG